MSDSAIPIPWDHLAWSQLSNTLAAASIAVSGFCTLQSLVMFLAGNSVLN